MGYMETLTPTELHLKFSLLKLYADALALYGIYGIHVYITFNRKSEMTNRSHERIMFHDFDSYV